MDFLHRIRQGRERRRLEEEYHRHRAREKREARRLEEKQRQQREREDHERRRHEVERQQREREEYERRRREVERRQREYEQRNQLITTNSLDLLSRLQSMPPDSFERLCQQLLLKSGIEDVKVTGRTGDEGIDGQGVMRAQGLITAPVVFQAKRYSGSVGVPKVRDFRGAMDGRASAGILITTGTFTKQAYAEAKREGTAKIRLIDGSELVALLKKHEIVLESL